MDLEAYILVGGRSRRFAGGEKPLAEMNGKTLAERALDTVQTALPGSKILFIARDADHFADEAVRLGSLYVYDMIENKGPVGGLYTALGNSGSEWLFLFACDMPLVTTELIKELWAACDEQAALVLPRQGDGKLQPLCAFYNVPKALPTVSEIIHRTGDPAALMTVIDALPAKVLDIKGKTSIWANVNTTADLAAAAEIERKLLDSGEI